MAKKVIKDNDFDFTMSFHADQMGGALIIGLYQSTVDNEFAVSCLFNSFNRTKETVFKDIREYIGINGDSIFPEESAVNEIFSIKYDDRNYHLENIFVRVGSLWTQLAHICNLFFELGLDKNRVDGNCFTNLPEDAVKKHKILDKVSTYVKNDKSFADRNCHSFVKNVRNILIHYNDFTGIKYYCDYLDKSDKVSFFPYGYYFSFVIYDMLMCMEFAKSVYKSFALKYR